MTEPIYWEDLYRTTSPENLPWNAGKPDADLVRLVEAGRIPVGHALDIGTGTGHDAVYLIQKGFNVIAIDISASAVRLARENASQAGLFGFFQIGDIRHIPVEDQYVEFVNDRGCFHLLDVPDWPKAVSEIHRVLAPRGLFLLRTFSDKHESSERAHRFAKTELEALFMPTFRIQDFWEGRFEGPAQARSYSWLMERR